jgi:hypothetical protein
MNKEKKRKEKTQKNVMGWPKPNALQAARPFRAANGGV